MLHDHVVFVARMHMQCGESAKQQYTSRSGPLRCCTMFVPNVFTFMLIMHARKILATEKANNKESNNNLWQKIKKSKKEKKIFKTNAKKVEHFTNEKLYAPTMHKSS